MKKLFIGIAATAALLTTAGLSQSRPEYGDAVNQYCAPETPFTGSCSLCHGSTEAQNAYLSGNLSYFCPPPACPDGDGDGYTDLSCGGTDCNDNDPAINPGAAENCTDGMDNNCNGQIDALDASAVGCPPVCTDADGDGYATEGGACGEIDCDDTDNAVFPGAAEICSDGIDNNCNGLTDPDEPSCAPVCTDADGDGYATEGGACGEIDCDDTDSAVFPGAAEICSDGIDNNCNGLTDLDEPSCAPVCTDADGDGYATEGGACGEIDCDDTDSAVYPGAVELCTDGIDNNCSGLIDTQDPAAEGCPPVCSDTDGDGYSVEGGNCGAVDCNDNDPFTYPGAAEACDDGQDNDCDAQVDEGCDPACPDADGDGYLDSTCGGVDCDDTDSLINPGAAEICGNGIDENCNGASDDECLACPDGGLLSIRETEYDAEDGELEISGRSHLNTTIAIMDGETGALLAEGIAVIGGKWKVEIEDLDPEAVPRTVTAVNSDGCAADRDVSVEGNDEEHHDRGDRYEREDRKHRRQERKTERRERRERERH